MPEVPDWFLTLILVLFVFWVGAGFGALGLALFVALRREDNEY